ncbi:hypothetical protein OQA88_11059 [Cercophora sp. LCS_1]
MANQSGQEARCYNCGETGHWVVACPEPTRNKPAGLERWQSEQHQQSQAAAERHHGPGHERRGPIVTRYPPPPSHFPPRYGAAPLPQGPPPGPPPALPPGYAPPGYAPPSYSPPPPPGYGGQPFVPPPPPPPPQYGGQFPHAPAPGPPPHQYSQPPVSQPPVGYSQPPFHGGYQPPPPAPPYYPGAAIPPPPPAFPQGGYPPQQFGAPPPPPPPQYGMAPAPPPPAVGQYPAPFPPSAPPPPPQARQFPLGPPPHVSGPISASPPSMLPAIPGRPPNLPPRPPPPVNQNQNQPGNRGRHGRHRERRSKGDRNRANQEGSTRGGNRNERRQDRQDRPDRPDRQDRQNGQPRRDRGDRNRSRQSAAVNRQDEERPVAHDVAEGNEAQEMPQREIRGQPEPRGDQDQEDKDSNFIDGFDITSESDMKLIFTDHETKNADPVGIPLPAEYSDAPTIPPAYDAKCIKSQYFNEDNVEEFVAPIRSTPRWSKARWELEFKKFPGMKSKRFPESDIDYDVYEPPTPLSPSAKIKMPPRFVVERPATQTPSNDKGKEEDSRSNQGSFSRARSPDWSLYHGTSSDRRDMESSSTRKFAKRSRDPSREDFDRSGRDSKRPRAPDTQRDERRDNHSRAHSSARSPRPNAENAWSPQLGESGGRGRGSSQYLDVRNDDKSSSSRDERAAYGSMRHDSGYHSGQSQDKARPSQRKGRQGSHQRRRSPSQSRSRSRAPSTADGSRSRSRSESPLTGFEAELLGYAVDDEEPEEKPKPKPKPAVKRPQVASAYGRRW